MSDYVPDTQDYAAAFGEGVTKYANPLAMLAQMFTNYGRSTSAAPQQNLTLLTNMLAGKTGAGVLKPGAAPAATAPQPTAKTQPIPVATPAPVSVGPGPFKINPELDPSTPVSKLKSLPALIAGEEPVDPTGGATSTGQVAPVAPIAPVVAPSVQTSNEAAINPTDVGNLSWMLPGGPTEALKLVQDTITNSLNTRKAGAEEVAAGASATKAVADLMESQRKNRMEPFERAATEALTRERLSTAGKNEAALDPVSVKRIAEATAQGTELGKAQADIEYAKSPMGQLPLDPAIVKEMGLKGVTKSGDLMLLVGRENYYKILDTWASTNAMKASAEISAKGAQAAAAEANKFSNMFLKGLEAGIAEQNKIIDQLDKTTIDLTNVTDPGQRTLKMLQNPKATIRTPEQIQYYNQAKFRRDEAVKQHAQILATLTTGKPATMPVDTTPPPTSPPGPSNLSPEALMPVEQTIVRDGITYEKRGGKWGVQLTPSSSTTKSVPKPIPPKVDAPKSSAPAPALEKPKKLERIPLSQIKREDNKSAAGVDVGKLLSGFLVNSSYERLLSLERDYKAGVISKTAYEEGRRKALESFVRGGA